MKTDTLFCTLYLFQPKLRAEFNIFIIQRLCLHIILFGELSLEVHVTLILHNNLLRLTFLFFCHLFFLRLWHCWGLRQRMYSWLFLLLTNRTSSALQNRDTFREHSQPSTLSDWSWGSAGLFWHAFSSTLPANLIKQTRTSATLTCLSLPLHQLCSPTPWSGWPHGEPDW